MNQQSTNPNDQTNANAEASSNEQAMPGDLIVVEKSEWYAFPPRLSHMHAAISHWT